MDRSEATLSDEERDTEQAAFELLASNRWFIVGRDDEGYGVWAVDDDAEAPVHRFPPTDDGSDAAFDAYAVLTRNARRRRLPITFMAIAAIAGCVWILANGYVAVRVLPGGQLSEGEQELLPWLQQIGQTAYPVFLVSTSMFVMLWMFRRDPPA